VLWVLFSNDFANNTFGRMNSTLQVEWGFCRPCIFARRRTCSGNESFTRRVLRHSSSLLSEEEQKTYAELYWYSHPGWVPGYQSIANYEQSINAVVVLFLNNTGGNSENAIAATFDDVLSVLRR
jgi:hypothetical protein